MKQSITFNLPPSLNKLINKNRGNKFVGANAKKKWTEYAANLVKEQILKGELSRYESKVYLEITLYYKSILNDPDNLFSSIKPLLDGCVKAGLIPCDSCKTIQSPILYNFCRNKDVQLVNLTFSNKPLFRIIHE